jgi:general secretion pathway protein J
MTGAHQAAPDERDDAGFTLVELLATIALLSLLSMLLVGSLRFGLKAWDRGITHSDRIEHVMLTQDFLQRDVEDAYPYFSNGERAQGGRF